MKHQITTKMLLMLALAAAALIAPAPASAQESPAENDEVVSVNARVARLSVAVTRITIPAPRQVRWEVRQDEGRVESFTVDAPGEANPLSLVVVLDLAEGGDGADNRLVREELESLPSRLRLKAAPRVFVAAGSAEGLRLKWPSAWPTTYSGDTRKALRDGVDAVEDGPGTRKALLVITNRVDELPPRAFEDADERLTTSAAFVCLLTIRRPGVKYGEPGKMILHSNLTTGEQLILRGGGGMIEAQFRYFTRLANAMHVISYQLDASKSAPGEHAAEVRVIADDTGRVFVAQLRKFSITQEGGK